MAEPTPPGLGEQAVRGFAMLSASQIARILLQVGSIVFLTRLLAPRDFGLFAMAVTVIGVGELLREFGLSAAAIQAKTLSTGQRDNLFWLNSAAGAAITVIVAATAPLLGAAYGQPIVAQIAIGLAPTFLLSGLATQYRASLVRALRFKPVAVAEMTSNAVALATGVTLALLGGGVWSLVAQQVIGGVALLVGYVSAARWRPGRYSRGEPMRPLLGFGGSVLTSQLLTYGTMTFDSIIVGARFGAADVGLYNRGLQLIRTPLNLVRGPVISVGLPVLSGLQDDPTRFMAFARRAQQALCYPILVAIGLFIATAPDSVGLLFGDQWLEAVPLMRAFAAGEAAATLMTVASLLLTARGLGRRLIALTSVGFVIRVVFVLAALPWGPFGVAVAYALAPVSMLPYVYWTLSRAISPESWGLALQGVRSLVVVGLSTAAATGLVWVLPPHAELVGVVGGTCGMAVSLAVLGAVPAVRRDYVGAFSTIKLLRRRAPQPGVMAA